MASFSINSDYINFAGGRTSSYLISITNAPSGGISIANSGFGTYFRVVTVTQNESYRIETKSTNTSGIVHNAYIRFVNNDDSNDYVDVTVRQRSVSGIMLYKMGNFLINGTNYNIAAPSSLRESIIFVDYLNPNDEEDLGVNITEDWLSYTAYYTDQGFKRFTIEFSENTGSSPRTGVVTFTNGSDTYTLSVIQNPPGETNYNITVPSSSGSILYMLPDDVLVDHTPTVDWLSGSGIVYMDTPGFNSYIILFSENTGSSSRTGNYNFTGYGSISITQRSSSPISYIEVTPSSSYVDYMSGSTRVAVSSDDLLSVSVSTSYDWISCYPEGSSREYYTVAYSTNTSSSQRSGVVNFMLPGVTTAYALYQGGQGGGEPSPVIGITPSSDTVTSAAGSVSVNLRTQNVDTVRCSVLDSWIHKISESIGGTYVFSYSTNTSSSPRTGTVRFTATGPGGTTSRDYTLTQAGIKLRIKSVIDNLRFYSEGGTVTVNLINKPSNLNNSITYIDGTGWLTVTDQTVVCSANIGIARKAVIRFYDTDDNTNYVDIPVIQGGSTYYESVWVNNVFIPSETGNYHYSIQISNPNLNRYFEGLTPIPQEGININRLVDDYIYSELLSQTQSEDWASMSMGYCTAELYNITETQTLETTHYLWNDWSGKEKRYDYTRSLNDPINHKGCNGMIIPFCVYKDTNDNKSFSIIQEDNNGISARLDQSYPQGPFNMRTDSYYDISKVEYILDDELLYSYDMDHCGEGALIYRNRFGGWDSFLLEGNISKTDNYSKLNYRTKNILHQGEKNTDSVNIDCTYETYTGWLSDEESERLVYHLASSPKVYFQDLNHPDEEIIPVRLTITNTEYKRFRNGKRLVNYTITFEKSYTEKVKD